MKTHITLTAVSALALLLSAPTAWSGQSGCETANQDILRLQHEKLNTAERVAKGATSIMPIGLVVKTVKGTEGRDLDMAAGEYNDRIDQRIAEIKDRCGVN